MRHAHGQVLTVVAFGLFATILVTILPLYMFQILDRVATSRSVPTLTMLFLLAGGAMLLLALLDWLRQQILIRAGITLEKRLTRPVIDIIFNAATGAPRSGMKRVVADIATVRCFLASRATVHLCDIPWIPLFLLFVGLFDIRLFLLATGFAVVMAGLPFLPRLVTKRRTGLITAHAAESDGQLNECLHHVPSLTAMGMAPVAIRRWLALRDSLAAREASVNGTFALVGTVAGLLRQLGMISVLALAAYLYVHDEVSSPALVAVALLTDRALAALAVVIRERRQAMDARNARLRLKTLFDEAAPTRERMPLPPPQGAVSLQQVLVAPPGTRSAVLKGVSLSLDAGASLGVIGPSGAGKSALARTLVGLWPPLQGTVRLDGNDLRNWNPDQLGAHIGYVSQEIELMDGTVAENIARLNAVDADAVIAAARQAGVHDTILRLPNGYDTQIGESGRTLSAGLRQRIALARALYGTPPLIVLDEPNAFLDTEGEQALVDAIRATREAGSTLVMITQKPTLLSVVDQVLVLRDGQIEMIGPRQDIMARFAKPTGAAGGALPSS